MSDGGTYYGEVLNGKPHGKGTARWGETEVYSGDWVSGKRQGKGKYTYTLVEGGGVPFEDYNESNMGHGTGEFTKKPTPDHGLMIHIMVKEKKLRNPLFRYCLTRIC
ncbi:MORN repeat protein [compost metagenome]